ncbi:MAG: baeRF3 domain-containing protein [Pirellulaceae bacterium]
MDTMDPFTRGQLKELAEASSEPAVSLYMPTVRAGREIRQNPIRLKNLIKQASAQLSERGMQEDQIRRLLGKTSSLDEHNDWWQHQSDGLAMFLGPDRFNCYRVPLAVEERVTVGKRFHVRPMVRLLQDDGHFHVLAVSQNRVRLLEGTHFSVSELDPEGLPSDLRSALNIDEYTSSLQQHSTGRPDPSVSVSFHGHGGSDLDVKKKNELLPFLRRINAALSVYFNNDHAPLVFAGVDYLFPIFQEACDHKGLLDTAITGNPGSLSPEKLHELAWAIVEPLFQKSREAAWNRFNDLAGSKSATDDLAEIIRAAAVGQIDTLMVAEGAEQWGSVEESSGKVVFLEPEAEDAEELVNYAVVHTLANGGIVYSLPAPHPFASGRFAAAILRYPLAPGPRADTRPVPMH